MRPDCSARYPGRLINSRRKKPGRPRCRRGRLQGRHPQGPRRHPVVHEVFGGWGRFAVRLFRQLALTNLTLLNAVSRSTRSPGRE
eukprot:3940475-Prymnesium_polylepis.1